MALLLCKSVVLMVLVSSMSLAMAEGEVGTGCGEGGDCLKLYTEADVMQNDGIDAPKDEAFQLVGTVLCAIFSLKLTLKHEAIPAFTCEGTASGLYTPGLGPLLNAQLTTPNSYDMVSRANSFRFTGTFLFFIIKLLDGSAELGSISANGITTVIGTGGGSISCKFT